MWVAELVGMGACMYVWVCVMGGWQHVTCVCGREKRRQRVLALYVCVWCVLCVCEFVLGVCVLQPVWWCFALYVRMNVFMLVCTCVLD